MVSQVERYYPRTRRAVGPVSQTDRYYDDTRNDVRCPYADELGELDEVKKHLGRTDNPHGVTAEQVGAVPLLGPGETADAATHGKTAVVTQNGTQGGFAVSGKQGAKPEDDAFVTKYQRESITAFGADETEVERYLIGPQARNQDDAILRVGDLAGTKPVTVTPESVGYVQKVTLALQIDRETIAHANTADAIDWVPSSKAVKAALDQKADTGHTHDNRYLRLSGGTLTGNVSASGSVTISVPILEALNYFVARSLVNEASHPYNHALYLGYAYHNQCDFYEVGGVYNFRMGDSASARIIGQITQNGIVELGTKLADKYAAKSHTHATAQVTGLTAALAQKANSADVYPKAQTYTKTEVDTLVAQAVATAKAELLEQLKTLYAPLSSVQATINGQTYRWAYSETYGTFAMQPVEA